MKRIPQPPVKAALRDLEEPDFWPGFVIALVGTVLLFAGARHETGLESVEGESVREHQLMRAFSSGGLRYVDKSAPPPPKLDDPAAAAEALDRWQREYASRQAQHWKVRVDMGAQSGCPT